MTQVSGGLVVIVILVIIHSHSGYKWDFPRYQAPFDGFLKWGGTPSYHPFLIGVFHEINHPAVKGGFPMAMATPQRLDPALAGFLGRPGVWHFWGFNL